MLSLSLMIGERERERRSVGGRDRGGERDTQRQRHSWEGRRERESDNMLFIHEFT